jgi:hypothetical protein
MIEALGKPGCTVVLATPCPERWDDEHHPSYREVWDEVLSTTRDPFEARERFEPEFARHQDYLERYRHGFGFHPVHGIMAIYPLKRLRHAGRVIVAHAQDPSIPVHCGFEAAPTIGRAGDGSRRARRGLFDRGGRLPAGDQSTVTPRPGRSPEAAAYMKHLRKEESRRKVTRAM